MPKCIPKVIFRDLRGWKYLVEKTVRYNTNILGFAEIIEYKGEVLARLCPSGELIVRPGYAWDGPSGPTIDTPDWMDASLVHDIMYQMMRCGKIPNYADDRAREKIRKKADLLMYRMLRDAGMSRFRASYSYYGVRIFASWAANPSFKRKND